MNELSKEAQESLDIGIAQFKEGKVEDADPSLLKVKDEEGKVLFEVTGKVIPPTQENEKIRAPKPAPKSSAIWNVIERIENDNDCNITQAMDVSGGVIMRTTLVIGEHLSESLVFLPGFEISNRRIRKQ